MGEERVVYLSGPITSGPRHLERLISRSRAASIKSQVTKENCANLREEAQRLRRERGETVVEPSTLDVSGWSQPDYISFWGSFIERYAKLVLFMPGWEYSVGCTSEFLRAHEHGVRTETVSGAAISSQEAINKINAAIEKIMSSARVADNSGLKTQAAKLRSVSLKLAERTLAVSVLQDEPLRKDRSLDLLASKMNVAQFVSFSPSSAGPHQEYARIAGLKSEHKIYVTRFGNRDIASLECR